MRKLTDKEVSEAKHLLSQGVLRKHVALKFNVSPQSISRATKGITKPENRGIRSRKKSMKIWGFIDNGE